MKYRVPLAVPANLEIRYAACLNVCKRNLEILSQPCASYAKRFFFIGNSSEFPIKKTAIPLSRYSCILFKSSFHFDPKSGADAGKRSVYKKTSVEDSPVVIHKGSQCFTVPRGAQPPHAAGFAFRCFTVIVSKGAPFLCTNCWRCFPVFV